jgi:hypothetical protein
VFFSLEYSWAENSSFEPCKAWIESLNSTLFCIFQYHTLMFQGSIRTSSVNIRLHTSSGNAGNLTYTHKKTLEFNTNPAPSNQVISQRIRKANHVNQQPHPKRYHGHPSILKQLQHPPWPPKHAEAAAASTMATQACWSSCSIHHGQQCPRQDFQLSKQVVSPFPFTRLLRLKLWITLKM